MQPVPPRRQFIDDNLRRVKEAIASITEDQEAMFGLPAYSLGGT
jgi:hypothetical protein